MTSYYRVFAPNLASPIRGYGSPVWDGTLPYTLPRVAVDHSPRDCAPGWNACTTPDGAIRVAGTSRGEFVRCFRVIDPVDLVVGETKVRASSWTIVEELDEWSDIPDGQPLLAALCELKRCQHSGRSGGLGLANLTGADLSGADLFEANLYGADLSWANLYGTNLTRADVSVANLYGTNLTIADLAGADLAEADLTRANLTRADLAEANLTRADLTEANLIGADLTEANLYGANLYGADLTGANLTGANLSWANLTRASLTGANLTGANLRGAKGVRHE